VGLSAAGSDTPSGLPTLSFGWDFGDGTVATGASVSHVWKRAGSYTARVTARDDEGAEALGTLNVTVRNIPPSVRVTAPRPGASVQKDEARELDGGGSDTPSDRPFLEYSWDLGDGNGTSERSGTHRFARPGTYVVKVTVSDDEGATDEESFTVTVQALPQPPPSGGGDRPAGSSFPLAPVLAAVAAIAVISLLAMIMIRRRK